MGNLNYKMFQNCCKRICLPAEMLTQNMFRCDGFCYLLISSDLMLNIQWVAIVSPTDHPKSVRNRSLIELFCGVVCVVILPF